MRLPNQISEATKRLNPEIFGPVVGAASGPVLQPNGGAPLVGGASKPKARRASRSARPQRRTIRPVLRVTIVALTRRAADLDNIMSGTKPVRDAIAREFGLDDSERQIDWQYGSQPTRGELGVMIRIEPI